jgi:phosphatidate cytidylyltransferase
MKQLQKRLISSAVLISLTLVTIFYAPQWFFLLIVEVFVLLAFNEFLDLAQKKGIVIHRALGLFFAALIPVSFYFPLTSMILIIAFLSLFLIHFHPKLREHALVSTAVTIFGILYIPWFFSYLIKIRALENGPFWVFYTILLVKGGDAGAYFVGKNYGRMKLMEHVSPNKSIEGAVGGFLATVILSLVSKIYLPQVPLLHFLILGVLVGILAQLGDLGESLIKRNVGVKDSGYVPGLGGILDVLDSLLLTIPFVYYYITTIQL